MHARADAVGRRGELSRGSGGCEGSVMYEATAEATGEEEPPKASVWLSCALLNSVPFDCFTES